MNNLPVTPFQRKVTLPQQPSLANSSSDGEGTVVSDLGLYWSYAGNHSCVSSWIHVQRIALTLPATFFSHLIFSCGLSLGVQWGGVGIDGSSITEHSKSLIFSAWNRNAPSLNLTHCSRKLIWPRLGITQICGYRYKYLEDNLIILPLQNSIKGFSLREYTFSSYTFWLCLHYQARIPFCGQYSNPSRVYTRRQSWLFQVTQLAWQVCIL